MAMHLTKTTERIISLGSIFYNGFRVSLETGALSENGGRSVEAGARAVCNGN
jgi:hypothetical protein